MSLAYAASRARAPNKVKRASEVQKLKKAVRVKGVAIPEPLLKALDAISENNAAQVLPADIKPATTEKA